MFDKSDGGRPRPWSGAFYDVCAGSFEKCMEFIRANAVTPPDCLPTWEIETDTRIVNSIYLYLTPPDSWEKLEKDLDRCIKADSLCAYSKSEECSTCVLPRDSQCHCDSLALEAIKERIRKLRGEGK